MGYRRDGNCLNIKTWCYKMEVSTELARAISPTSNFHNQTAQKEQRKTKNLRNQHMQGGKVVNYNNLKHNILHRKNRTFKL